MTQLELIKHLLGLVESKGRPAVAKKLGITQSYLRDILMGARKPGPRVYKALGFEKTVVVTYTEKGGEDAKD